MWYDFRNRRNDTQIGGMVFQSPTRFLLAVALVICLAASSGVAQYSIPATSFRPDTALSGDWRGNVISSDGRRFQLMLHISAYMSGECTVTYDIVDQQLFGRRMTSASCDAGRLLFINDSLNASFDGMFVPSYGIIDGIWEQSRTRVPTRLYKVRPKVRLQEPSGSTPYVADHISITNRAEGVQLGATLVVPDKGHDWPLIILISDRGQQNRDALDATGHRPFLVLADQFARAKWASLRLDDRGVGSSSDASTAQLQHGVSDIVAAIDRVKNDPTIDGSRIILLGHGEGGLIANEVARQRPKNVQGIIFAATPAMDGRTWLLEHARETDRLQGIDPDVTRAAVDLLRNWYDIVERGMTEDETVAAVAEASDSVITHHGELLTVYPAAVRLQRHDREGYIRAQLLPWLSSYRDARAPDRLDQIKVPGLVLIAGGDAIVPSKLNMLAWETLSDERNDLEIVRFSRVNHGFQPCTTCTAEEAVHSSVTVEPQVIERIVQWSNRLIGR